MPNRATHTIETYPSTNCKLCESSGVLLYSGLRDILGTVEGHWNIRQCPKCTLLWVDPVPRPEELYKAYDEYPTHEEVKDNKGYKERLKAGYLAYRYRYRAEEVSKIYTILGQFLWLLPHKRVAMEFWFKRIKKVIGGRLLDIGCGSGDLVRSMSQWGWEAEGIDIDDRAIEIAKSRGLSVVVGDFIKADYPDNHFDVIISSHVFEHVYEPVEFLKKCWRLLKPKGQLLIATPNAFSMQRGLFGKDWMALDAPRHLYLFNPKSLELCVRLAGIDNYKIITTNRGSKFIAMASLYLKKHGRYHWQDRIELKDRLMADLMELIEFMVLAVNKQIGVELLLCATKTMEVYKC